jgi:hypothetical protein
VIVNGPTKSRIVNFVRDHVHMGAVEVGKRTTDELAIANTASADADAVADVTVEIQGTDKGQFRLSPNQKLGFDGQRAEIESGRAGEIRIAATPNHIGTNTASLLWHVHSRRPDLGPAYSVRTELAVNAREPGYEAKDAAQVAGMVEAHREQQIDEMKAESFAIPPPLGDTASAKLILIPNQIGRIRNGRLSALANLQRDLNDADTPRFSHQIWEAAAIKAIKATCNAMATVAAGAIAGPVAAVVAPLLGQVIEHYASQNMITHIHAGKPITSTNRFFQSQLDSLAHNAEDEENRYAWLISKARKTETPDVAIIALHAALQRMSAQAAGIQYLTALNEWSCLLAGGAKYQSDIIESQDPSPRTRRQGKLMVGLQQFETPDGELKLARGSWGGVTQRVNRTLRNGRSTAESHDSKVTEPTTQLNLSVPVGAINPILRIEFTIIDEYGTERDHVIEQFPDDAAPVYGSHTKDWLSRRYQLTNRDGAREIVEFIKQQSMHAIIGGGGQ